MAVIFPDSLNSSARMENEERLAAIENYIDYMCEQIEFYAEARRRVSDEMALLLSELQKTVETEE